MSQQKPTAKQQMATQGDIDKIKSLIKSTQFCMLTTLDSEGHLRSRPMGVNGELESSPDGSCTITFFTYKDSHKCAEMHAHHDKLNLSFSDPKQQNYVSISGTGHVSQDRAEMERRWNPMLKAWFPEGLDTPGVALLKVCIDKAEYWDAPSSLVAHAVGFVKGQLGQKVEPAEHRAVTMGAAGGKVEHKEQTAAEKKVETK